eukprot:1654132-Pleurochrysis_carterae.AAC.1
MESWPGRERRRAEGPASYWQALGRPPGADQFFKYCEEKCRHSERLERMWWSRRWMRGQGYVATHSIGLSQAPLQGERGMQSTGL